MRRMNPLMEKRDRVVGSLVGLAVCDAVGTTVEAMPPGSFDLVLDMLGGGKFDLLPGQVRLETECMCMKPLLACSGRMILAWHCV